MVNEKKIQGKRKIQPRKPNRVCYLTRKKRKIACKFYRAWKKKVPTNRTCPITLSKVEHNAPEVKAWFDLITGNMKRRRYSAVNLAQYYSSQYSLADPETRTPINSVILRRLQKRSGIPVHDHWNKMVKREILGVCTEMYENSEVLVKLFLRTHNLFYNSLHMVIKSIEPGNDVTLMEFVTTLLIMSLLDPETVETIKDEFCEFLLFNMHTMISKAKSPQFIRNVVENQVDAAQTLTDAKQSKQERDNMIEEKTYALLEREYISTDMVDTVKTMTDLGISLMETLTKSSAFFEHRIVHDERDCILLLKPRSDAENKAIDSSTVSEFKLIQSIVTAMKRRMKGPWLEIRYAALVPSAQNGWENYDDDDSDRRRHNTDDTDAQQGDE